MSRRRPRGFTLIELMVALLVSSLLVGMILAIFSRMSIAYRGQQQIAGVQQVLAAARAAIEVDAKQAGLQMAQGFKIFSDGPGVLHPPVNILNNPSGTGPDQIAFFYADTTTQAVVTGGVLPNLTVDLPASFAANDLVVMVRVDSTVGQAGVGPNDALIATYDACVLQVATASTGNPGPITFTAGPPWSNGAFAYCASPATGLMLYKFIARGYKIDVSTPARAAIGPLQQSQTGGLFNNASDNWSDLAYGFTDLQSAIQIFDNDGVDTDGDGDPTREWYSSQAQQAKTQSGVPPASLAIPLQMTISLVARTDRDVEGISTPKTPQLTVPLNPNNNTIGDRAEVILPAAPPWLADPALQGARLYRYITFGVDFRNLGVGR